MASFRAQLSPDEEKTLRRVAIDTLEPGDVREQDTKRLLTLGLIQQADGLLIPTERGLERLQIRRPPTGNAGRRLKRRRLPV